MHSASRIAQASQKSISDSTSQGEVRCVSTFTDVKLCCGEDSGEMWIPDVLWKAARESQCTWGVLGTRKVCLADSFRGFTSRHTTDFSASTSQVFHRHQHWPHSLLTTHNLKLSTPREGDIKPPYRDIAHPQANHQDFSRGWLAAAVGTNTLISSLEEAKLLVEFASQSLRQHGVRWSTWESSSLACGSKDHRHVSECAEASGGETAWGRPSTVAD